MSDALQPPRIDAIVLKGGLDQITPSLSLGNGYARQSINFECAVTGGYTRIAGYERFDGQPSPTDSAATVLLQVITIRNIHPPFPYTPPLAVMGSHVICNLNNSIVAEGTIVDVNLQNVTVSVLSGEWVPASTMGVGNDPGPYSNVGDIESVSSNITPEFYATCKAYLANTYRAVIAAPPGLGPTRGVVEFNDVVYAFRNNVAGTATDIYKSTAAGWVQVPLFNTVSFTAGGTGVPADGNTLTQGGVTAVIKRVVLTSGTWAGGTAAGQLIIAAPAGGHFSAALATAGTVTVTLSGVETAQALLPGGKFEFAEHNFYGQSATNRIYGCDGVNKAFEFDGTVLVPIATGATVDTPTHLAIHKNYLFLAVGSSIMYSAPGLPYNYTAISGAAEIATGDTVTGIISMPGDANSTSLGVFNRSNTHVLYQRGLYDGSFSNWFLISYNTGVGSLPFSTQNMAQTYAFDDRGANTIQTTLQYGNFDQSALTNQVLPFINERINLLTNSTLCRRKSQYRVFFSDGWALYITIANNKLLGCMPIYFPNPVFCTYEGKKNDGTDVMYFGSTNGMVYQMEKGTSFDGAEIDASFTLNISNAKSPRTLKRYRKAIFEISTYGSSFALFDFSYILGYDSSEYNQPDFTSYSQYVGQSRWDTFTWDTFFWDQNQTEAPECGLEGTAENIAVVVHSVSDTVPEFTINSILVLYSPRRIMR